MSAELRETELHQTNTQLQVWWADEYPEYPLSGFCERIQTKGSGVAMPIPTVAAVIYSNLGAKPCQARLLIALLFITRLLIACLPWLQTLS